MKLDSSGEGDIGTNVNDDATWVDRGRVLSCGHRWWSYGGRRHWEASICVSSWVNLEKKEKEKGAGDGGVCV